MQPGMMLFPPPTRPFDLSRIVAEFNVEAYGASPAASASANTTAILTAIAAASAVSGAVRFPAKLYNINDVTFAYDNVTIRGGGMPFPTNDRTAFQPGGTILKGGAFLLNYHTNIRVSDMGFDSTVAGTYAIASGDSAPGQQNIRVQNVTALGRAFATSHAFYFTAGNNIVVNGCRAYKFDHALAARTSYLQLNQFYAEDCLSSSLVLKGIHEYDSLDCTVSDIQVFGNSIQAAPIVIEGHDGRVSGRHVLSNILMENVTRGILIKSADNGVGGGWGSVDKIRINNVIVNGAQYEAFLAQYRNISNVSINGMDAYNCGQAYGGQAAFSNLTDSATISLTNCKTDSTLKTQGYFQRAEINGVDNAANVRTLDAEDRQASTIVAVKGGYTTVYRQADTFTPDVAAGSVNGHASVPGPGTIVVADSGNKLSFASGAMVWTSGVTTYDPAAIFDKAIPRVPGMVIRFTMTMTAARVGLGLMTTPLTANFASGRRHVIDYNPGNIKVGATGTGSQNTVSTFGAGTVTFYIALRRQGAMYFAKGAGVFTYPELLKIDEVGLDALLYAMIYNVGTTTSISVADIVTLDNHWLPAPLVSDGFSTWPVADGKGSLEGIEGGAGVGGSGASWTTQSGTIAGVSGRAKATVLASGAAEATVALSTNRVIVRGALSSVGAGLIARRTDANNYLWLHHDGTNLLLDQILAGVTTNLKTTAVAFVANAIAELDFTSATAANLYYGGDYMSFTTGINAALTAANAGIRFTDLVAEIDNFQVCARGSAGEYAALDAL